jgi:hypothetical protein
MSIPKSEFIKPLADPVISYIYSDAEHAGLAAKSFIQAVVGKCGETFGNVVSVTPQKFEQGDIEHRTYRVDIQAKSDTNKYANQEVQLSLDEALPIRNLMSAMQLFQRHAARGTTPAQLEDALPDVFAINICAHEPPDDGSSDYFRSAHFTYDQEPRSVKIPQFSLYEIQLRRFPNAEPDFADPLYCWTWMLYNMHFNEISPEEALEMEPRLQTFYEQDEGLRQFCKQYGYATADEHVREQYHLWNMEHLRRLGEASGARNQGYRQGKAEGLKQGEERGRREAKLETARSLMVMEIPADIVVKSTGITKKEYAQLRKELEFEAAQEPEQGGPTMSM